MRCCTLPCVTPARVSRDLGGAGRGAALSRSSRSDWLAATITHAVAAAAPPAKHNDAAAFPSPASAAAAWRLRLWLFRTPTFLRHRCALTRPRPAPQRPLCHGARTRVGRAGAARPIVQRACQSASSGGSRQRHTRRATPPGEQVPAADGRAPALLVLLHGTGADEHDLLDAGEELARTPGRRPFCSATYVMARRAAQATSLGRPTAVVSLRAPLPAPWGGYRWFEGAARSIRAAHVRVATPTPLRKPCAGYSSDPEPIALQRTVAGAVKPPLAARRAARCANACVRATVQTACRASSRCWTRRRRRWAPIQPQLLC